MRTIRRRTLVLGVLLIGACARRENGPPPPPRLDTVEVKPAEDATLTTAGDRQETRRESGFSGVLPEDFPADLPLYRPSTLVDFGSGPDGRFVVLQTPDALAAVRTRLPALLRAHGWRDGEAGEWRPATGRPVRISIENAHPGSRIRIDYAGAARRQ
ncbi:MAG: hypothetical protein ACM3OB_08000 [Acidobacteriota bacterium]